MTTANRVQALRLSRCPTPSHGFIYAAAILAVCVGCERAPVGAGYFSGWTNGISIGLQRRPASGSFELDIGVIGVVSETCYGDLKATATSFRGTIPCHGNMLPSAAWPNADLKTQRADEDFQLEWDSGRCGWWLTMLSSTSPRTFLPYRAPMDGLAPSCQKAQQVSSTPPPVTTRPPNPSSSAAVGEAQFRSDDRVKQLIKTELGVSAEVDGDRLIPLDVGTEDNDFVVSLDGTMIAFVRTDTSKHDSDFAPLTQLWLVRVPARSAVLLLNAKSDNNPERNLSFFHDLRFLADGRLYFASHAWVSADATHSIDPSARSERYEFPNEMLPYRLSGSRDGDFLVSGTTLIDGGGRVSVTEILQTRRDTVVRRFHDYDGRADPELAEFFRDSASTLPSTAGAPGGPGLEVHSGTSGP